MQSILCFTLPISNAENLFSLCNESLQFMFSRSCQDLELQVLF